MIDEHRKDCCCIRCEDAGKHHQSLRESHDRLLAALQRLKDVQPSESPIWDFREWEYSISDAKEAITAAEQLTKGNGDE